MDTKLSPRKKALIPGARTYTHKAADLRPALLESLKALNTDKVSQNDHLLTVLIFETVADTIKVDMWYLHAPDHDIPYEETLREVNNLYQEGYFKRFGVSNYAAWEVAQICELCKANGWKKPDAYQGVYNALHRAVEPELFPCLRFYGIAFYEFNPLAGGFLTDRYQRNTAEHEEGSRFDPARNQGQSYRGKYWNDVYFDALDIIRPAAEKLGLTTAEAAVRWVNHHSLMKKEHGDTIIIGASSAQQLEENLTNLEKGPLPDELVKAFDEGWAIVKGSCKPYYH